MVHCALCVVRCVCALFVVFVLILFKAILRDSYPVLQTTDDDVHDEL